MKRLLIIAFLLMPLSVFAANSNVGTSGAAFLKLGAGARPTAMGNSFVAVADDVNTVYFNPAGLAFVKTPEITALHTQYFQDTNYNFGAFAYPTKRGAFAISAQTLKIDNIDRRGLDESDLGEFENTDAAYTLSYGRTITTSFSAGGSIRYISQEIGGASASGYGADVGLHKKMNSWPLSVGLAVKNLGTKIEFENESDPQPLTIDLGLASKLLRERLILSGDIFKPRDNDVQFGLGTEFAQPVGKDVRFALRAGYNTQGTDADGTTGYSLGGGFGIRRLDIDFAWVPYGDLGDTMRYSLSFKF